MLLKRALFALLMVFGITAGAIAPTVAASSQAAVAPAPIAFQGDDDDADDEDVDADATADDADDDDDADDRDDDGGNATGASNGDAITVVDDRGNEILEITVNEVIVDWDDFSSFSTPDRGYYYLALNVTVENISDDEQEFSDFDFMVRDEFGFLYGTTFVSIDEESPSADIGELESDDIDAGDSMTGLVIFALPNEGAIVDAFYAPYGRLITIATFE